MQTIGTAVHDKLEDWGIIKPTNNNSIVQFEGEDDDDEETTTTTTAPAETTSELTTETTTKGGIVQFDGEDDEDEPTTETTTKGGIVQFEGEDDEDETTTETTTTKPTTETTTKKPKPSTDKPAITTPEDTEKEEAHFVGLRVEYDKTFKNHYIYGEELTYDGLKLTKVFSDDSEEELPIELCYCTTGIDMNKTGDHTLKVIYDTCLVEIQITVRPDEETRGSQICSNDLYDYLLTQNGAYITAYHGDEAKINLDYVDSNKVYAISAGVFKNSDIEFFSAENLEKIFDSAFENSTSLVDCYTPRVKSIGKNAFDGCTSLADVAFSDDLDELGTAAFRKTAITSLTLPEAITSVPKSLCEECKSLEEVTFRGKVKTVGALAFSDCGSLASVKGTESITKAEMYAFYNDTLVDFDKFPSNLNYAGEQAFAYCNSLNIGEIGESLNEIGEAAFLGCHKLEKVTINSNIKSVPQEAFRGTHIIELVIEEGVEEICQGAFMSISARSVTLPSTMKRIGTYGLYTVFLREVHFNKKIQEVADDAFANSSRLKLYVYDNTPALTYAIENDVKYVI